ncbi:MAG: MFS transporter [Geobacteraceae bacterium]|nr:MFS transporter [Geobacteraceae bacterium]
MKYPSFTQENPPLALYALLATASSGFGQTFFVSIFGASLRHEFALSNSAYGLIYGIATLCSAALLIRMGALADHWALTRVTTLALVLLACGCVVLGLATHWTVLVLGFLFIRLGGQAMLTHLGMTVAGRYFHLGRGRIMALTAAGFPLAEAILPAGAGFIMAQNWWGGWRLPWFGAAFFLLLVVLPLLFWLARGAQHPAHMHSTDSAATPDSLSRAQVLRDPGFYILLPATLAAPFSVTALMFHQSTIGELRGWSLEMIATSLSCFALGHFVSLFAAGPLIDRLGAQRSLPLVLLPMGCGMLVLAFSATDWTPYLYLGLVGTTMGGSGAAGGALWPERYGTRHIGAIRSLAQATLVFSTALAPFLGGYLLDTSASATVFALALGAGIALSIVLVFFAPARMRIRV